MIGNVFEHEARDDGVEGPRCERQGFGRPARVGDASGAFLRDPELSPRRIGADRERRAELHREPRDLPFPGTDVEDALRSCEALRGQRQDLLFVLGVSAVGEAVLPPLGVPFPEVAVPEIGRHRLSGRYRGSARGMRPVWLSGTFATCSGVPSATTSAAAGTALRPEVDQPVGRLDDVEVVLDHEDRIARRRQGAAARGASAGRPRSGGRWSARRGCRSCARSTACRVRSRASRAALHRPTTSAPVGRAARSPARRRRASATGARSAADSRRTPAPPRPACRARRRCSCPSM